MIEGIQSNTSAVHVISFPFSILQFTSRLPQPHPSPLLHQLHPHLHHPQ